MIYSSMKTFAQILTEILILTLHIYNFLQNILQGEIDLA